MNKEEEFYTIRQHSKSSRINYAIVIHKYEKLHGMTLDELIQEAEEDEKQNIPLKERKIKKRLQEFQISLRTYSYNTQNSSMTKIKTVYKTFEIQLPYLININKVQKTLATNYDELLTKEDIKHVLENESSSKFKALILFLSSTGTGLAEALNLTVEDFIHATKEYTNSYNIEEVLLSLEKREDIVLTFMMRRQKTGKQYYTFCTPETTRMIIQELKERLLKKGLDYTDSLFGYTRQGVYSKYHRVNNQLQLPYKKNGHHKFHSHGLRKFFCVTMEEAGMNKNDIDFLCGRTPDELTDAYFPIAPERRIARYKHFMNAVTLFDEVNYVDITSKEKEDYDNIKQELERQKQDNIEIKQMLSELSHLL